MRPQPVRPLPGVPPFVLGLTVVRGVPTPVIDLASIVGGTAAALSRYVSLRAGQRQIAVAVDAVTAIRVIEPDVWASLPPLASEASSAISAVGRIDADLFLALTAARLVPDDVWPVLDGAAS